jgi:signal transduction histidine kinase
MLAKARAEDASQAKTNFLANMSHELRNPLNALMGITQLLERDYAHDEKITQFVNLMRQSSNRLLNTIGDVLDLTQIESNKIVVNPAPFNLLEVATKAISMFVPLAEKKGLELSIDSISNKDIVVLLDEKLLEQVVHNLISNAIKFTSSGSIKVSVVCDKMLGNSFAGIKIQDSGVGMNDDFIKHKLFGSFEQESAGMSKAFSGSGLGLHIAKRYVDFMGGHIKVESERNIGSSFIVYLPV